MYTYIYIYIYGVYINKYIYMYLFIVYSVYIGSSQVLELHTMGWGDGVGC